MFVRKIQQFALEKIGFNVFIFDYRGYGLSDGVISEMGTYSDAEAAWNYVLNEKQITPDNIIIFGRSLGAAIAVDLSTKQNPAALIMESSFSSVQDLASQIYPFLPVRWLSRFHYNNYEKIQKINCPVLFIHSRNDEIIPFSHGEKLYNTANQPKQFLEIRGSHNDGFIVSEKKYISGIKDFLVKLNKIINNGVVK